MADFRIVTLLPTQSVAGAQQSQLPQGSVQGSNPLAGLPPGTLLNGFIVNRDSGGNPVLRTDSGDIPFATSFFLKIGSEVALRVENAGGNTLAHILTVDGQPPEIAQGQSAFADAPEVIVGNNLSAAQLATVEQAAAALDTAEPQPAVIVTGTIIAPHTDAQTPTSASPATGTQLTLKLVSLETPPNTTTATSAPVTTSAVTQPAAPQATSNALSAYARTANATPSVTPPAAAPAQPAAVTTAAPTNTTPAATPTAPTNPLPAATAPIGTTPADPVTVDTSPLPAATTAPLQAGQTVAATVIGNAPNNEAILQTAVGLVQLQPGTVLPTGSKTIFEIMNVALPTQASASATTAAAATPAPLTELALQWNTLQQIFGLLTGRAAQTGTDFSQANMPWLNAGGAAVAQSSLSAQNMPTGLMMFITALRSGDFRNWIGKDNTQWLEDQGHGDLLKKADSEFGSIARQFTQAPTQQWQTLFFPVAVSGELQQARLFVKRDRKQGGGSGQDKASEDTRFVVEVDLTQLGEMQMDGFVRRGGAEVQFDLIIRSMIPLTQEMQQDMLQIYTSAGELTGYKGQLAFQTVKEFPVTPMEDIVAQGTNTVMA